MKFLDLKPVLVTDPSTGKNYNVANLLALLHEHPPREFVEEINGHIRDLLTYVPADSDDEFFKSRFPLIYLKNTCEILYDLIDVLSEIEEPMPQKGGSHA